MSKYTEEYRRQLIEAGDKAQGETQAVDPGPRSRWPRRILLAILVLLLVSFTPEAWAQYQAFRARQQEAKAPATADIKSGRVKQNDTPVHTTGSVGAPTPEPSSFILCGMGAGALYFAARRRRKA